MTANEFIFTDSIEEVTEWQEDSYLEAELERWRESKEYMEKH